MRREVVLMIDFMFKKDKILKQAIFFTAVIGCWIACTMYFLYLDLDAQLELNDYQNEIAHLTVSLNDYYQSTIECAVNNPSFSEVEKFISQQPLSHLIGVQRQVDEMELHTYTLSSINDKVRDALMASLGNIDESLVNLASQEYVGESAAYLSMQNRQFQNITGEIDLMLNLTFKEQSLLRDNIISKLSISSLILIGFIALTNIWLFIFKTLNPINEIKQMLLARGSGFHDGILSFDRDDEIGDLVKSYNHLHKRAVTIERLINKLGEHDNFEEILDFVFESFMPYIPYNRIGIAVLSQDKKQIRALSARSDRAVRLGKNYESRLEDTSLDSIIDSGEPRILNDLESYYMFKKSSESTRLMVEEGMRSSVTLPLIVRNECVGVVFFSSIQKSVYNEDHIRFLKTIAGSLASAFDHSFLHDQLLLSTIQGFAQLVESKDSDTGNHIDRMQYYSVMIAELLYKTGDFKNELQESLIKQIRDFSPLHDIGKVAVPDEILLKPGKLTSEEYRIMQEHVVIGSDILKNMNDQIGGQNRAFYRTGIEIVRHHHEKYDGTGYPDRLSGEEIPLSARIVALADVLDALTSKRPYKEAFTMERAKEIIFEGRGNHFDPKIVDVVMCNWDKFIHQADAFKRMEMENPLFLIS